MKEGINGVIFHCLIRDVKEINVVEGIIRGVLECSVGWRKRRDPSFIRGYRGISDCEYLEFETDFRINEGNRDLVLATADEIRAAINNTVIISTARDPRFEIRRIEGSDDFLSPRDRERYNIVNYLNDSNKTETKEYMAEEKRTKAKQHGDERGVMLNQEEINALFYGMMERRGTF